MDRRDISSGKSAAVKAFTSCAGSDGTSCTGRLFRTIPAPGVGCTSSMKRSEQTAATMLVARKTKSMAQETLDSRLLSVLEAMAEETVKKTSGTMIMKIRLRNRSPRGRMARAASGRQEPSSTPPAMDRSRSRGNP